MAGLNSNNKLKHLPLGNRDVDSTINGVLQTFQDFQDDDVWKIFYEEFEGFTKEDFRWETVIQLWNLRTLLRRQVVWVMKNKCVIIAKSLFATLQEDKPTLWTKDEVKNYYNKESFCYFYLKYLNESKFGKKFRITEFWSPILSLVTSSTSLRFLSTALAASAPLNAMIDLKSTP